MSETYDYSAVWLSAPVELDSGKEQNRKPRARIQLLREGEWYHPSAPNQRLKIDSKLLDEIVENFKSGVRGTELPTNENHADPNCTRSPAWVVDMEKAPQGGLYGVLEFTDEKLFDDVKSGKVKYISPELQFGWVDPATGRKHNVMKAAAFTNFPYLKGMEPAKILNLSEVAELDHDLVALSCYKDFNKALDELKEELEEHGVDDWSGFAEGLKKLFKKVDNHDDAQDAIDMANNLANELAQYKKFVAMGNATAHAIVSRYAAPLDTAMKKLLTEKGIPLSEVNLGILDIPGADPSSPAMDEPESSDPTMGNDPDNPTTDMNGNPDPQSLSGALDPDANNQSLPMQCGSCAKLMDGSCPFQGVDVKIAAAADGNCPQYLSKQAQVTDSGDQTMPDRVAGGSSTPDTDVTRANANLGESTSNGENNDMPKTLEEMEAMIAALSEKVTSLEATGAGQANLAEVDNLRAQLAAIQSEKVSDSRKTILNRFVENGKITPAQAQICLSMFAVNDGATDVKLSDGQTDATFETLLSELLESIEQQVPLAESGANANVRRAAGEPTAAGKTEHENHFEKYMNRAKEIALAEGGDAGIHLGRAMREVNRELAVGSN